MGAVVLCGGQSSRMGFDKFLLPLGERTFLDCLLEKLTGSVTGPIVCSASTSTKKAIVEIVERIGGDKVRVVVDENQDCGPVEGIRVGLSALESEVEWAFVTGCDVPLLRPQVIALLVDATKEQEVEAVLPHRGERIYGITALYRTNIGATIDAMIEQGSLRVSDLARSLNCCMIDVDDFRSADPNFDSMKNFNSPEQYLDFIKAHGLDCPNSILEQLAKTND